MPIIPKDLLLRLDEIIVQYNFIIPPYVEPYTYIKNSFLQGTFRESKDKLSALKNYLLYKTDAIFLSDLDLIKFNPGYTPHFSRNELLRSASIPNNNIQILSSLVYPSVPLKSLNQKLFYFEKQQLSIKDIFRKIDNRDEKLLRQHNVLFYLAEWMLDYFEMENSVKLYFTALRLLLK